MALRLRGEREGRFGGEGSEHGGMLQRRGLCLCLCLCGCFPLALDPRTDARNLAIPANPTYARRPVIFSFSKAFRTPLDNHTICSLLFFPLQLVCLWEQGTCGASERFIFSGISCRLRSAETRETGLELGMA
jgi:hypothetical protein